MYKWFERDLENAFCAWNRPVQMLTEHLLCASDELYIVSNLGTVGRK